MRRTILANSHDDDGRHEAAEPWLHGSPPAAGPPPREPIFNIPPMVLSLLAIMIAVMVYRSTLDEDADTHFVLLMALIPARLVGYAAELPGAWRPSTRNS